MMFFFSFGSSCSVLPVHAFINISKNEKHIINNKPLNMQQLRCSFYKEIPKGKKKMEEKKRKCRHKVEGVIPSRLHLFCINSPQSSHHNPASRNVHNLCHGFVKYEQNVTALLHTQKKERSPTNASNMPRKVKICRQLYLRSAYYITAGQQRNTSIVSNLIVCMSSFTPIYRVRSKVLHFLDKKQYCQISVPQLLLQADQVKRSFSRKNSHQACYLWLQMVL